jgi:hypothetical protein
MEQGPGGTFAWINQHLLIVESKPVLHLCNQILEQLVRLHVQAVHLHFLQLVQLLEQRVRFWVEGENVADALEFMECGNSLRRFWPFLLNVPGLPTVEGSATRDPAKPWGKRFAFGAEKAWAAVASVKWMGNVKRRFYTTVSSDGTFSSSLISPLMAAVFTGAGCFSPSTRHLKIRKYEWHFVVKWSDWSEKWADQSPWLNDWRRLDQMVTIKLIDQHSAMIEEKHRSKSDDQ